MKVSPFQLARDDRVYEVELPLEAFPRLEALVLEALGPIRVCVQFERDEQGRCRMHGELEAALRIRCANCEQGGRFRLVTEVNACLVTSDEKASELLSELDPIVLPGAQVTPADLFEDDLLLALPERPCVSIDQCPNQPHYDPDPVPDAERDNPFAVLSRIRRNP